MAVPLLPGEAALDEDWIADIIELAHQQPDDAVAKNTARTYVQLMSCAAGLFEPAELARLAPRKRSKLCRPETNGNGAPGTDPIAGTEAIAYDFLARGGKHSRPFITLAVYDALSRSSNGFHGRTDRTCALPDAVKRTALSIETFHKASLVHDDIQDDDQFRYGEATLHRKYGTPTAINVGDYLIGLGYRLVSRESKTLGADAVSDILDRLADAHMKLSEGQGAELLWRDSLDKRLTSSDALNIYALKTAPAFEAALYAGLRLAGPVSAGADLVSQFARNLGIAFQILNDLNDWDGDDHNKLSAAGDTIGGRPTVLWALALETLTPA
ncbi:MAG TPA: polyprenyl synthetase family protein, partial [Burkholderiaceae bacterium]|nr:polyprenyl synthetase family protein [Burkholderiaceae bacterium]